MSDAEPVLSPDPAAAKKRAPPKPSTSADPGVSLLPISRVHKIIKADKDVRLCSKEAIFLISKATEFMLGKLTNTAYSSARLQKRAKLVKYQDLSAVASRPEWFYLAEVIPATVPLSRALALRALSDGGSILEPTDENHPSHPSTHGNTQFQGGPVKKGRRKSGVPTAGTKKLDDGAGSAGGSVAGDRMDVE